MTTRAKLASSLSFAASLITSLTGRAQSASSYVVPPTAFTHPAISDTRCRSMVTKSSYYFSHYWWTTKKHYSPTALPDITWDSSYANGVEVNVREAANAAVTMAVCADWDGYLESATKLALSDIRLRAAKLVVGVANKHILYSKGAAWGHSWQSGYWAYVTGLAGWLVWDSQLTNPADRDKVAAIVADEADFQLINHRPEIWRCTATDALQIAGSAVGKAHYTDGPQGVRNGDSAMEEDIWNSAILDFAATMMPAHPHAAVWRRRAAQYAITGKLTKANALDTVTRVNGFTPNEWVIGTSLGFASGVPQIGQAGYNLESNYIVWNHHRRNPDYMQADLVGLAACLHHGLANTATPEAMRWNSDKIYGAMRTVSLSPGNKPFFQSLTSPTLYFPDKMDWGNARHTGYWAWDSLVETQITGVGNTTADIPVSPTTWDGLHGNAAKAMQDRTGVMPEGQIVLNDTEDRYPGREGWHALHASFIVLNKILTNARRITWTNRPLD